MATGELGQMCNPREGTHPVPGAAWAADNGCFGKDYPGDARWIDWLRRYAAREADRCLFAVAPDVVGDAEATIARSLPWVPVIRHLGYPVAFVAQDGQQHVEVPWAALDVLFVGGTTEFKLGPAAAHLVREALDRGKRVHMGRVNSLRRYTYAKALGCHTVDGTYLSFGPVKNLARLRRWGMTQPATTGGAQ